MKKNKREKAASYASRLLNVRHRSQKELKERLFRKGFDSETVQETLAYLRKDNIINDEKFAKLWVESRMLSNPKGVIVLRKELMQKGIAPKTIDDVLSGKKEEEESVAIRLAEKKKAQLKNAPFIKARKKIFNFLARRGFSFSVIESAMNKIGF